MLTPKQRQRLKAQAHQLKPAIHIGKGGITPTFIAEMDATMERLELVKVKLNQNASEDEQKVIDTLCAQIEGLEFVWSIGHTLLFFRPSRTKATEYPLT
jgi:RNA-binding protein